MPYQYQNGTGTVRSFGGVSFKRSPKEPSYEEEDAKVDELLVKLGKRPAELLPHFDQCPNPACGSRLIHTTVNRVKCQGCGSILAQREPTSSPEKVDGDV